MNRRPRATAAALATALILALVTVRTSARAGAIPYGTGLQSLADGGQLDFTLNVNPSLPVPTLSSETAGVHVIQIGPGATYRMTSDSTLLALYLDPKSTTPPPAPPVIFDVAKGQIVPPPLLGSDGKAVLDSSGNPQFASPLTILSNSKGVDLNAINVLVGLKDVTPAGGGTNAELLGLTLVSTNPPPVIPTPPPTPPVVTTPPPTPPVVTPEPPPKVITPEPLSLALWSVVAGAGLLRARGLRRRRSAE